MYNKGCSSWFLTFFPLTSSKDMKVMAELTLGSGAFYPNFQDIWRYFSIYLVLCTKNEFQRTLVHSRCMWYSIFICMYIFCLIQLEGQQPCLLVLLCSAPPSSFSSFSFFLTWICSRRVAKEQLWDIVRKTVKSATSTVKNHDVELGLQKQS